MQKRWQSLATKFDLQRTTLVLLVLEESLKKKKKFGLQTI